MKVCHVTLDGRKFIVRLSDAGEPLSIKQRKWYMPGTYMACLYDAPYWHKSAPLTGTPKRIIEALDDR